MGGFPGSNYWPGGVQDLLPPRKPVWRFLFSSWSLCNGLLNGGVGLCWVSTLKGGFLGLGFMGFLRKSKATEDVLIIEGDIALHLLPELPYAPQQKVWLAPSRQIGFFCPKLEGFGIGHCLLPLQFSDVPAGKLGVGQWQETLMMKAWWCWWGLVVIFNPVPLTNPLRELE